MHKSDCIDLSAISFGDQPFPHFSSTSALLNGLETHLFEWLEKTPEWGLTETDFYTQYEFSLLDVRLPESLQCLVDTHTIEIIQNTFKATLGTESLELIGVTAHKLINGHRIGVHNDNLDGEETHRLIIQINPNWDESKGGFLMLFNSSKAEDVSKLVQPVNNSAFGFGISNRSYHAVSTVYDFSRYTLVYTFKEK